MLILDVLVLEFTELMRSYYGLTNLILLQDKRTSAQRKDPSYMTSEELHFASYMCLKGPGLGTWSLETLK